jgi:DNA mismatch repair ATPase MutS
MAELMRLKEVVDLAARTEGQSGRRVLYLLDEILQGTNSRERHIAVERVLHHLLRHGALGAVSTHDLELATSPLLREACQCVHFRETLHDADAQYPMTFDYCLRDGVATTTNALKLLALVGLGD